MRVLFFALAGVVLVVGVIFFGQGVGLIGGSSMTGETTWAIVGGVCIVLGLALGAFLVRSGVRWRHAGPGHEDGH